MKRKGRKRDKKKKKKKDGNLAYLGSKKKRQPQKNKGVDASEIKWDPAGSKGVGKVSFPPEKILEIDEDGIVHDAGTYKVTGTTVEGSRILDTTVVSTKIRPSGFWAWVRGWF